MRAKRGTILSLGDKCDSCVILQICGSCHDEANDPGFEFEVDAEDRCDPPRHDRGRHREAAEARRQIRARRRGDPHALLAAAFAAHDAAEALTQRWTAR